MLDLNQPEPTEASQQTRPPTRWSCTRCDEPFRGVPEHSLDPRWAFARCKACGKRVVVVGKFSRTPDDLPPSSSTGDADPARPFGRE
jgi:DNA-directed RNA polymerase subunit RPC12/RpoP